LPNGLRVVLDPLPDRRAIAAGLFVAGGAHLDPAGESGLAHYLEHAVFRGAGGRSGRDMNQAVDGRGGTWNGYTDKEMTWFVCEALSEDAPFAIDLLADLVTAPDFPPDLCRRELDVVVAEAEEAADDGEDRVHDLLDAALWPRSAYGRPVVGLVDEVSELGVADLRAHHARTYRPERACAVVSGAFEPAAVRACLERRLGPWQAGKGPATAPPTAPGLTARTAQSAPLTQVHLCLAVPALRRRDPGLVAGHVLTEAVGGGPASRLFERLREEHALAYTVYAEMEAYADRGLMGAYVAVSPEALDAAASLLAEEFTRVARDGLEADEVARAKAALRGGWLMDSESSAARMHRRGEEELMGGGARPVEAWLADLEAVDAGTVNGLARTLWPVGAAGRRWVALGPLAPSWRPRSHLRVV
jgi:predicted Zn-dependent peptidase